MSLVPPTVVADLTGLKQAKRQIRWLAANGWTFEVGADGRPKIDQEYYRQRMGMREEKKRRPRFERLASGTT